MLPFAILICILAAGPAAGGERYALLVGVKQYDKTQLASLDHTENDVTVLAEVLRQGGYKRIVLLTQARGAFEALSMPTAANIRRELKSILEGRKPDDSVVLAFCGHGVQFAGSDEPYFCPMDAALKDRTTLVSLSEVYKAMGKCKARAKVLFSDACRNDPLPKNQRAVPVKDVFTPKAGSGREKPPENVAALFSCSAGEVAYESDKLKHGIFFHFLIEGLRGKAAPRGKDVTLNSLADYVQREVGDHVKEAVGATVRQRPELVSRANFPITLLPGGLAPMKADPRAVKEMTDRALAELRAGEYRKAADTASQAMQSAPNSAFLLAVRAHALDRLKQPKKALADADKAIQIDANLAQPYFTRGNVFLLTENNPRKALPEFDEAIKRYPRHVMAHVHRGHIHLRLGHLDRAEADLTEAIRLDPIFAQAYRTRAQVALKRGKHDDALKDLGRAIELNPKSATAHYDRALILVGLKKQGDALASLDEAIKLDPRMARAFNTRGNIHLDRKDLDRALADYTDAVRLDPKFSVALYNRSLVFTRKKDYRTALADLNESIKLDSRFSRAWQQRGAVRYLMKQHDRAVADLNKAIELDPMNAGAYLDRARVHRARGDKALAQQDEAKGKQLKEK